MTTVQDNIRGKVAIVTGASSGLGESTARHLAARGAKVVLAARRTDRLEKVVAEIREAGGEAIAVATDVSRRADLDQLAFEITAMLFRANFAWIVTENERVLNQARVGIRGVLDRVAAEVVSRGRIRKPRKR